MVQRSGGGLVADVIEEDNEESRLKLLHVITLIPQEVGM